jgi:AraC-like DNA-binding protein
MEAEPCCAVRITFVIVRGLMDPLSDVLSLLKPRGYVSGGFDIAGLSVAFSRHDGIKCYALTSGACWLTVEGVRDPVTLTAGDCFLLPHGRPFGLATDRKLPAIGARELRAARESGRLPAHNEGATCFVIGSHFSFGGDHADILLGVLPPIVHIREESDKAAMRWYIERMMQELREPQEGSALIAQQLAYTILIQALRLHLAEGLRGGVGWLFALADPQMRAAITAMHDEPARRWTLPDLAERAGMSRSTFALRFKETVGSSPMDYLTRWRMLLAGDRLATGSDPISVIAPSLGYESESAFSTAFKRVMGCSPREYGRAGA